MKASTGWSIVSDDPLDPRVGPLLDESERALRAQYRDEHIFTASPRELAAPGCTFLTARLDDADPASVPAGCIGLVPTSAGVAEIKRLYVTPSARRRGLARDLVRAVEDTARRGGIGLLQLETGRAQAAAVRLYEALGYRPIPAFGAYRDSPESLCYEKALSARHP